MGREAVTGRPGTNELAVALCCDRNYLPLALFVIRQIAFHCPERQFDFVIAASDVEALPDWAVALGVHLHRPGVVPNVGNTKRFGGSLVSLHRLLLAQELGGRYRRILYLDCDVFVEGGDFGRLLEVNLGPHPLGAVRDVPHLYEAGFHAREFRAAGLPALPYLNSGLLLIDTAAFEAQGVRERCWESATKYPQAMVLADQSLLNLALQGKFAELAPAWNWQGNFRFPLVPYRYPVFLRHFVGPTKPDRDAKGLLEARFRQAYADFFRLHFPERLAGLPPPVDPGPMPFMKAAHLVLRHLQAQKLMAEGLARFGDPFDVKV
jgi:Glycosyl transferase family 8